jgi:hypothetical protein
VQPMQAGVIKDSQLSCTARLLSHLIHRRTKAADHLIGDPEGDALTWLVMIELISET